MTTKNNQEYKIHCARCMSKYIMRNLAIRDRVGGKYQRSRELAVIRQIRKYWRLQANYFIDGSRDWEVWKINERLNVKKNVSGDEVPEGDIQDLVDNMPYQEEVAILLVSQMQKSMNKAGKNTIKKYGLDKFNIKFDAETNPTAKTFLGEKLKLELSNNPKNISATTKNGIKAVLRKGAIEGLTHSEIGKLIRQQETAGVFSVARSELIAQTEIGRAYGQANNIPMRDFKTLYPEKVVQKKWLTVGDDRVRIEHTDNEDDGWIDIERVHSGTGEDFAPSADFGCRCVELYRTR